MKILFSAVCLLFMGGAKAATLDLTAPLNPVSVPDGPEFATSVLHRPWDMSQLRQITRDYGFTSILSSGGIWSGVSGSNPNNSRGPLTGGFDNFKVFPVTPNFLRPPPPGSASPEYIPYSSYFDNGTLYGHLAPLDGDRYSRLSFRMSLPQADRSNVAIWWATTFNTLPEVDANWVLVQDSQPVFGPYSLQKTPSGFRIYDVDVNRSGHDPEQNTARANPQIRSGGPWAGNVYGFFIQPSSEAKATDNVPVSFDWIRAYDPVRSPEVTISWNSSGFAAFDTVQLWVDTDSSGFDGDLFIDGLTNDGSYVLKTGALPPGDYWVYVRGVNHDGGTLSEIARSGYSARIRIGEPPLVEVTSPGYTTGEDYAASELGNPWDFNDSSDWVFTSQMSQISTTGGIFRARTDPPIAPFPESDDQIWLNTTRGGQVVPINTRKYRYFSFRMRVPDATGYGDLDDKLERGWLARVIWWNATGTPEVDGSYSKDIPLFEGWRTYTVDLWDNVFLEDPVLIPAVPQLGWEEQASMRNLRFDPMEAHFPTFFEIDWISLNAENLLTNGSFDITWTAQDTDSATVDVRVFADPEIRPGVLQRTATPIHTASGRPLGTDSFTWSPGSLNQPVFIRVEITDGAHVVEALSRTPITTGFFPPTASTVPVRGDYDGDGLSDLMVYEPATGKWYLRPSGGGAPLSIQWGDASMTPVPGDYTGDGLFDLALYQASSGFWFIRTLQTGPPVTFGQQWGDLSMDPVSGDFNGDGVYDLAVYQRTTGFWFIRSLGPIGPSNPPITFGQQWGDVSMIPVSGDFTGDGVADLAVYQQATGNWFIRSLGPLGPDNPPVTFGQQWGDSSMDPVSGDFNGDDVADLAVYQRSSGLWFIRSLGPLGPSNPPITFGQPWGDASMDPVPGDYNGDGVADLPVYQRTTGNWFIRSLGLGPPLLFGEKWGVP